MTLLMPTCERVTALLTAYEEGALGPLDWLGMKLHLALCPPCQAFLATFERTPALLRRAWADDSPALAEPALAGALAALRAGRLPSGPQHHPEEEAWRALQPGGDALVAVLLRLHLGQCEACRRTWGAGHAPLELPAGPPAASLAAVLQSGTPWTWRRHGLGGTELARVGVDPATGAVLYLARLREGRQAPPHEHRGLEQALVLRGRLQDGPAHLAPGDWMAHPAGDRHAPEADPGGECWCLIHQVRPVRFLGWRRVFNLGPASLFS